MRYVKSGKFRRVSDSIFKSPHLLFGCVSNYGLKQKYVRQQKVDINDRAGRNQAVILNRPPYAGAEHQTREMNKVARRALENTEQTLAKVTRIQAGSYAVDDGRCIIKNNSGWLIVDADGAHNFGPVPTLAAAKPAFRISDHRPENTGCQ